MKKTHRMLKTCIALVVMVLLAVGGSAQAIPWMPSPVILSGPTSVKGGETFELTVTFAQTVNSMQQYNATIEAEGAEVMQLNGGALWQSGDPMINLLDMPGLTGQESTSATITLQAHETATANGISVTFVNGMYYMSEDDSVKPEKISVPDIVWTAGSGGQTTETPEPTPTPCPTLPSIPLPEGVSIVSCSPVHIQESDIGAVLKGYEVPSASDPHKVGTLLEQFNVSDSQIVSLSVANAEGQTLANDSIIGTGGIFTITDKSGQTIVSTIIVQGDVTGTGIMSLTQLVRMASALTGTPLEGAYLLAGDFTGNGEIDLTDLVQEAKLFTECG